MAVGITGPCVKCLPRRTNSVTMITKEGNRNPRILCDKHLKEEKIDNIIKALKVKVED